jgi:hypothetical protein
MALNTHSTLFDAKTFQAYPPMTTEGGRTLTTCARFCESFGQIIAPI